VLHGEKHAARGTPPGKTVCGRRYCFSGALAHHHQMQSDPSTGTLKTFIKAVGLVLLISVLFVVIFASEGARPLGYLFFGIIGFLAWRMFRVWDKLTVQLYALIQSIVTGVALSQIGSLCWYESKYVIPGSVLLFLGPPFERFLVRYTGFSIAPAQPCSPRATTDEATGTPWQNNPFHTT
jgi:hypothetical protein